MNYEIHYYSGFRAEPGPLVGLDGNRAWPIPIGHWPNAQIEKIIKKSLVVVQELIALLFDKSSSFIKKGME